MSGARRLDADEGLALLLAIMATLVVSALGAALLLASSAESMMAANFQRSVEAQYAAEAAVERAAADAAVVLDWTTVLNGLTLSSFVDGTAGTRIAADGTRIDLDAIVNVANCGRASTCGEADLVAVSGDRQWGRNNPRWRLFGSGPLDSIVPGLSGVSSFYAVVLVGDDPAENDDQPLVDGGAPANAELDNAGADVLVLRGEVFGPRGSYARVEATYQRSAGFVSWRPLR